VEAGTLAAIDALHARLMTPFLEARTAEGFLEEIALSDEAKKMFSELKTQLCGAIDSLATGMTRLADRASDAVQRDRVAGLARVAARLSTELAVIEPNRTDEFYHWFSTRKTRTGGIHATLTRTPYEIAAPLAETLLAKTPRVVFVSATLAAGKDGFGYLKARLGLDGEDAPAPLETIQGSPFDFAKNCLLYVPRHLGPPASSPEYAEALLTELENLIVIAGGRTFALFTSHRMLQLAAERWRGKIPYPLFVQGEQPPGRLVEAFKEANNGVLLGASSFWEGVDVPGEALSLVALDKLPFATPDSPPQRAREERIQKESGNAFSAHSLPQATLRLKQGFGRLLRTKNDRGVVAILDERLWTKSYGAQLLCALPPCPKTDAIDDVRTFFHPSP
jgi:ATP-dependent DNA helicase DinG